MPARDPNPPPMGAHGQRRATKRQENVGSIVFGACILVALVFGFAAPKFVPDSSGLAGAYVIQAVIFLVAVGGAGCALKGHPLGTVIDKRNRLSLSKLQMLMWTVLVISALAVLVEWRLAHELRMDALKVTIPPELLAAMGIAATSLVAAPAVLSLKPEGTDQAVAINDPRAPIRLVDLVQGDEEGNRDTIDLSKLQQLAITLLLLGVYASVTFDTFAAVCWTNAATTKGCTTGAGLPPLSRDFVELMAVSHAGYLLYKAAPKPSAGPADTSGGPVRGGSPEALG